MSQIKRKSPQNRSVFLKKVFKKVTRLISHNVEIENEDVILVANSSNDQGAHSSQTVESLEPPVKKRSKC